jgi:hypothetical protein
MISVFFILIAILAYIGESSIHFDSVGMMPVNPVYTSILYILELINKFELSILRIYKYIYRNKYKLINKAFF